MKRRVLRIMGKDDISYQKMHEYAKRVLDEEGIPFMEMHFEEEDVMEGEEEVDCLYKEAVRIAVENDGVATGTLQRLLHVGYNRAADLMKSLEKYGIVKSFEESNNKGKRELASLGQFKRERLVECEDNPVSIRIGKAGNKDVRLNLRKNPHTFIVGKAGSGKEELINSIITDLAGNHDENSPELILIDTKKTYRGILKKLNSPNLKVIEDAKKARNKILWLVRENERRYREFQITQTRNNCDYNEKTGKKMRDIIVIIGEIADFIRSDEGKFFMEAFLRLEQMSRCAGIFQLLATEAPALDIIEPCLSVTASSKIIFKTLFSSDLEYLSQRNGLKRIIKKGEAYFIDWENPPVKIKTAGATN